MPCKTVCKLQVLPPFPSYSMSYMNRLACAVEAQLVVTQREHSNDLGDRRDTATGCSHVNNVVERVARVASSSVDSAIGESTWFAQRLLVVCLGSLFLEAANMSDNAKLT